MKHIDKLGEPEVMALSMYAGEPCRICGITLTMKLVEHNTVFAGYSKDNKARSAHGSCWRNRGKDNPRTWAHP